MTNLIDSLDRIDAQVFLFFNSHHNGFFDVVFYWVSNKWFWLPLYLFIIFLIYRVYKKRSILIFSCVILLITLSDQLSSGLIKPIVMRLRPSHQPDLMELVHLSPAGPGGLYGFVSGHATNAFALLVFLILVLDKRFNWMKMGLTFWALLVCYSRMYVGVHYPGDVVAGILLGSMVGYVIAQLYKNMDRFAIKRSWLPVMVVAPSRHN